MTISYIPSLFIIFAMTIGFPYGFKMFCKASVYVAKLRAFFIINITKIKCNLIKAKSIIKLRSIELYQFIRIKIWVNKYYRKQISISIKKGEIETANELKKSLKQINKLEREKFMKFTDQLVDWLAKMLKETT